MQIEPQTKQSLIEEHYYINVDNDYWYDCTIDNFKEQMAYIGIEVEQVYFSISCSQGDGAMYEGRIYDWGLFLNHMGITDKHVVKLAFDGWAMKFEHSNSHYCHENTVSFDADIPIPVNDCRYSSDEQHEEAFIRDYSPYPEDSIRSAVWLVCLRQYRWLDFTDDMEKAIKQTMKDLYRLLVAEYEQQSSDEAVWDTIVANELHKQSEEECDD
jgi:hypothetical protein